MCYNWFVYAHTVSDTDCSGWQRHKRPQRALTGLLHTHTVHMHIRTYILAYTAYVYMQEDSGRTLMSCMYVCMYTNSERRFEGHCATYRHICMQPTTLSTHLRPRTVPMCVQTSDLLTDCAL